MSTDPPSHRRPPKPADPKDLRWRRDDEDEDLFPDELPLDSDEAFEEALERALARHGLDHPGPTGGAGTDLPPLTPRHEDEGLDEPSHRQSGRRGAADIERLARLVADEQGGGSRSPSEDLDPDPLPSPEQGRRLSWAGAPLATAAVLVALAALLGIWRLSARLDHLEARLAVAAPPANGTAKAPANGGAQLQSISPSGLREEFRALTEQLRAQVTHDTLRLQGDLRDLAVRSEQRWQALEGGRVDSQRSPARAPAPALAQTAPSAGPPGPSPAAQKPAPPQTSKPAPAKPAVGPATASAGPGPWVIALASVPDATQATQEVARLRGLGLAAESQKIQADGKSWHRINVGGFPTREAAQAYASKAKENPKLARVFADYRIAKL